MAGQLFLVTPESPSISRKVPRTQLCSASFRSMTGSVMGVSFGGMVAQELIKRHKSRVTKLILACTSSGGAGGSSYPLHELEELEPEEKIKLSIKINDLRINDVWIENYQEQWEFLMLQAQTNTVFKTDRENLLKQLLARKDHDTFDSLKDINVPVFLLGGKYDGIAPKSNMEIIHNKVKDSKLEFYEGGHLFLIQDPEAFKDIIKWISR